MRYQTKTTIRQVKSFGEFIKRRRDELGLSQVDVAKAVGYRNGEYIGMIEKPENNRINRKFSIDRLPQLASVLRVPLNDLAKLYLEEHAPIFAHALFKEPSSMRRGRFRLKNEEEFMMKFRMLKMEMRDPIVRMVEQLYRETVKSRIA